MFTHKYNGLPQDKKKWVTNLYLDDLQDGSLSKEEFAFCWNNWIKKIVRPVSALIVVDVQNDFISGSLAISNCPAQHNGEEVSKFNSQNIWM